MLGQHLVRDRRPREGHWLHIAARARGPFTDRIRHASRFADAYTHLAFIVANYNHSAESKATPALEHLGHAGDIHNALVKLISLFKRPSSIHYAS
jgi:hypothetical protein